METVTNRIAPAPFWLGLFLVTQLVAALGCATGPGPRLMAQERGQYNEILRQTDDEQLLLNIVRLRYNDTPHFLDMGSVVVQYGYEQRANAGVQFGIQGLFGSAAADDGGGGVGGGLTYSERPTVTYVPLQGKDYAQRMLTSIPVEVIWLLANSGWSVERLLVLCVERLNDIENAVTASGPPPLEAPIFERFQTFAELARRLQQQRALTLKAVPASAPDEGIYLYMRLRPEVSEQAREDVRQLSQLLGFSEEMELIRLSPSRLEGAEFFALMRTRSLLGVLYFMAHSVEPPEKHIEQGVVRITKDEYGEPFDWDRVTGRVMKIHSSEKRPTSAFVKVRYRDHWYYIDDRNADAKATFSLLQLLFSLQSTTGSGRLPLLTLPTG